MRIILALSASIVLSLSCGQKKSDNWGTKIAYESVPFLGGQDGYQVYRAPTMVISQKGTVLAFSEGRVNGPADEGDIDVVLKRSTDGGKSWGPLQVLENDGPNPCKNQNPVVLPSGRILLVWLWNKSIPSEADRTTRDVFITYSDDDGKTWSKSRNITSMTQEANWGWSGMGPVHGIVKRTNPNKGRVLLASRHSEPDSRGRSHVIYSDDGGETWKIGGIVSREMTSESTVVELSNGDIMLNSRNQNGTENFRVVSVSKDGGQTFAETYLEKQLVEPRGVQASLLYYGTSERTGKGIILFSNPNNETMRSDGTVKLSEDDAKTWSEAVAYAPKPEPYFTGYSDLIRMPNGDIGVLYERGDFNGDENKGNRYKEVGFSVIKSENFKALRSKRDNDDTIDPPTPTPIPPVVQCNIPRPGAPCMQQPGVVFNCSASAKNGQAYSVSGVCEMDLKYDLLQKACEAGDSVDLASVKCTTNTVVP